MNVLTLNAGSSSLKVALFAIDAAHEACVVARNVNGTDHVQALGEVLDALDPALLVGVTAIGHRLVHGGPDHSAPARVDAKLRASLTDLVRFAPLHLPAELAVLDACTARFPNVAQVVCFDTAFHRQLPEVAQRFALPRDLFDAGVRRYGFHGLSYEYVVETIGAANLGRAVIAHLGSGASMAAVKDGRSIDTTMGLTPTGGLMMATRSGDLDPGVLVHLMDQRGCGARDLETLVNQRSGLLGVSGTTGDMKTLLEASAHDPHAAQAVEMFCYTARKFIGALAAALEGIETLVFTGGIGESAPSVRDRICAGLGHLGAFRVLVVRTDEARMIARHAFRILK